MAAVVLAVLSAGAAAVAGDRLAPMLPSWIWHTNQREARQQARFTKSFTVTKEVTSAVLHCAGESAGLAVALDGETVVDLQPYDPIAQIDVTDLLRPGEHRVVVRATGVAGPSAFFLVLEIRHADGDSLRIVSDQSWQTGLAGDDSQAIEFGTVDQRFVIPPKRQIGIKATDNYEQWKQALGSEAGINPATFWIADQFEVELVRSALPDEDSWVSMALDPHGRVLIAKESQGLLRMTLSADGSRVTKTELVNDSLQECRGILPVGGDLYLNANNSKALYRLRGRQDGFGEPELIFASAGSVGHGRNDLALGPDGQIYAIHGDAVALPTNATDHTSPLRDRRAQEGHLLRIDPTTRAVELLACGLRNPFGIDFNAAGDLFTYDADAEYDMGAPWYRPTRVSHLVTGGDYGWRAVTKSWPPYYPDHAAGARPNLDIGKGSPTAVKFGRRSNFPGRFRQALFILDWAYGRIIAVHAIPRGASYVMTAETFLQGRPLNVTDLDFGPDGSLYFVTGGRKTLSALYRVRFVGQADQPDRAVSPQQQARMDFARQSRATRRGLEDQLLSDPSAVSLDLVWQQLANPDPWIQYAAAGVLERLPVEQWASRALQETSPPVAVRSLLSLARSRRQDLNGAVAARLNKVTLGRCSRSDKLAALETYALCFNEVSAPAILAATREQLEAIYPDDSFAVNRQTSELLVKLGSESVVEKTIALLQRTADQTAQMHYLYVLRNAKTGWTIDRRRVYFQALAAAGQYLGGAGMPDFLRKIREESLATLTETETAALAPIIEDRPEPEATAEGPPRKFVRKWTVDEVMAMEPDHPPRAEGGRELFRAASCSQCHRFAGDGTLMGPDLTSVNRRFSRRDLLISIIQPSKVIAENYRSLQILTTDGTVLVGQTGLGGDYRSPLLRLATDPRQPLKTVEIPKSEIESQQWSPVSWMPAGLLDTLSGNEILDLISYLESGSQ